MISYVAKKLYGDNYDENSPMIYRYEMSHLCSVIANQT